MSQAGRAGPSGGCSCLFLPLIPSPVPGVAARGVPGFPPLSPKSLQSPNCRREEVSVELAAPFRGLEIGILAAWLSHLVSSLRTVKGFDRLAEER